MIKYKINIYDALKRAGMTTYKAKTSGVIGQDTLRKIREENTTGITLKTINAICAILELQPKDILEYIDTDKDAESRNKIISKKSDK